MMKSVIPAQITTVEDKIAGNLNFTQILLLIAAMLLATGIYVILPEPMKLSGYKIVLVIGTLITFGGLSLRIKERVVLNWVILLTTFILRPKTYVFNKNSMYLREVETLADETSNKASAKSTKKIISKVSDKKLDYTEILRSKNFSIKLTK